MSYPFEFPGLDRWEGSRARLLSLSLGLVKRGVEVHILSKGDPSFRGDIFRGINLHKLPRVANTAAGRYLSPILTGNKVRQLTRKLGFDIIHSHLPVTAASVAAWRPLLRSRILFDTHDWFKLHDELYYNIPFLPDSLSRVVDELERKIAQRHDGVAVTTPLLLKLVGELSRPFVIPNAVDTELFRPGKSRFRENFLPGRQFVVGFVGFVSVHQGFWELMKAVKIVSSEVENTKLLAVGGGFVDEAKEFARELGIADKVMFTGPKRIPYEQIPDLISGMDVAVSPKQRFPRWHEYAQPLKMLEYLACGVPVVATPLKEQSRLMLEANGGVVAIGFDSTAIADAILRLHHSPDVLWNQDESRRYAFANHSPDIVLNKLMTAYNELLI